MGLALEVGAQMAGALDYIHSVRVVHGDVKPENLLVMAAGPPRPLLKLSDFGLASVLASSKASNATRAGGTATYLAPERARGEAYGCKADMWALGCVLLEVTLTLTLTLTLTDPD